MKHHRRKNDVTLHHFVLIALSVGAILFPAHGAFGGDAMPDYFSFEDHQAFVLLPSNPSEKGGPMPWVWYAPTRAGSTPNGSNEWLFQQLLDSGIAVAGIDVGESYGSPEGRAVYSKFYTYATNEKGLAAKMCMLAQSRGGLMLYNWAAENPDKVEAIAGIYTAVNLESYPGLATAAPAYNMTEQELRDHLAENNPIDRLQPLADAGIPIFHIHGDSDITVPLIANSQVLYDRYTALGGNMQLVVVPGKGHEEIPEFFQSPELLDFVESHVAPEPNAGALMSAAAAFGLFVYVCRKGKRSVSTLRDIR